MKYKKILQELVKTLNYEHKISIENGVEERYIRVDDILMFIKELKEKYK